MEIICLLCGFFFRALLWSSFLLCQEIVYAEVVATPLLVLVPSASSNDPASLPPFQKAFPELPWDKLEEEGRMVVVLEGQGKSAAAAEQIVIH